jgi:carboxyl-terminal processing protease
VAAALAWVVIVTTPGQAVPSSTIKELKTAAEQFEKQGHWAKACGHYAKVLEIQSNLPGVRDRYLYCLRRYLQERRHNDPTYLKEVLTLDYAKSVRLYEFIFGYLGEQALDPDRVTPRELYLKGLEEFENALISPVFIMTHLDKVPRNKIADFRATLQNHWKNQTVNTMTQATNLINKIATLARQQLKLKTTTTVMEFTCGCCFAVDDYTMYLTPAELRGLCNSLKGDSIGVGLKLGLKGDKLVITEVAPDSPAKTEPRPPLAPFDEVLSIDGKSTAKMPPDVAMDLLHGEPGTEVELVVYSAALGTRVLTLPRRAVFVPSVKYELMSGQVGYLAITGFQSSTVQELDAALANLAKLEIRALVLDLRGNSGGLFPIAIDAARRFLNSGVIVSTQTHDPKQNITYYSQNTGAFALPLVVLVDGRTASAAEILAGALKENRRARLVGMPSFGKGCIQEVYSISPSPGVVFPGGLRVTVARFLSPNGTPYTGKGIEPHNLVENDFMTKTDLQLQAAFDEAQRLLEEMDKPEAMM